MRPYLKNKLKQKRLGVMGQVVKCATLRVQKPVPPIKKKKIKKDTGGGRW
jgi:hypothetical protein